MKRSKMNLNDVRSRATAYFEECDRENALCDAKHPLPKPYTFSGLLCALAMTRQEFADLYQTPGGRRFCNHALMKIEAFIEENALSGRLSATFAQGTLKNSFGWGERQDTETEAPTVSVTLSEDAADLAE